MHAGGVSHEPVDSLYLRANAFMTLFCMVSTLFRADMSPERRLEGEGEATVTDSPPREAPGESCVCVCVCWKKTVAYSNHSTLPQARPVWEESHSRTSTTAIVACNTSSVHCK